MSKTIFLCCILSWFQCSIFGQNLPNCSEFIKYDVLKPRTALVKGPVSKYGDNYIEVTYNYPGEYSQKVESKLSTVLSDEMILDLMGDTEPLVYFIKFPVENATITKISRNNKPTCSEVEMYPLKRVTETHRMIISTDNTITTIKNGVQVTSKEPQRTPSTSQSVEEICGLEGGTASITPFIYGGTALQRGQFPWLTAIFEKTVEGLRFLCGGSLISNKFVVSAAHCFKLKNLSADRIMVFLGRHNLTNYMEENFIMRDIRDIRISPEYNAESFHDADVAILEMSIPVSFTEYIRPICLWNEPTELHRVVGAAAVVAGWGSNEIGHTVSQVPKSVQVTIVSNEACIRSSPVFIALTSERTFCAGKRDDTGPCKGDSGGGLMISRQGRWLLRGIVSSGLSRADRCDLQEYTVYCDVAKHLSRAASQ